VAYSIKIVIDDIADSPDMDTKLKIINKYAVEITIFKDLATFGV